MENKKEKIADFKAAISSTVRSLSNSEKIEVSFGNESLRSGVNSIRLPELSPINNKLNYNLTASSKNIFSRISKILNEGILVNPEIKVSGNLYELFYGD